MLSEAKFFMLNTSFCDKNGLLPFNFGYVVKIESLILSSFFLPIFIDKIFSRVLYRNWVSLKRECHFKIKIMIMKKISNSSAYDL